MENDDKWRPFRASTNCFIDDDNNDDNNEKSRKFDPLYDRSTTPAIPKAPDDNPHI